MVVQQQDAVDAVDEQIEGLGESDGLTDYPLDEFFVRDDRRTVRDVLHGLGRGRYVMDPEFQRDFIWSDDKQSKLIESVLMRVPLPVFYLAEDQEGRMVVVDGLQRLSTFRRFADDGLRLRLPERPDLHGAQFSGLPPKLQNRIEDCNLIFYILDAKAPDRARLDIFDRVNSGQPLSRQQMRNCLCMGEATRFLREEVRTDVFLNATGRSLNTQTMRDREFVNRFCAFRIIGVDAYSDMDDFLAEALKSMNAAPGELDELSLAFRNSMQNNFHVFGKHAFRKHTPGQERRNMINAALWDVMSIGLARYSPDAVEERSEALRSAFYRLMDDEEFQHAITYSTNAVKQVRFRFAAANKMFTETLDA